VISVFLSAMCLSGCCLVGVQLNTTEQWVYEGENGSEASDVEASRKFCRSEVEHQCFAAVSRLCKSQNYSETLNPSMCLNFSETGQIGDMLIPSGRKTFVSRAALGPIECKEGFARCMTARGFRFKEVTEMVCRPLPVF